MPIPANRSTVLLTIKNIEDRTGLTEWTVRKLVSAGELEYSGLQFCKPEPAPPRLTVAAETNCRDWLVEQMKSPKATTKPIYQTKAMEEFPGLSAKSFGRAWDNARKEPTTHPSWQKRGPAPSL